MAAQTQSDEAVTVEAENVGGIEHTQVSFPPGVSVLTGRNATNRSSFLQAIMAALGSDRASLKAGAEEGRAEIAVEGDTYTRTLTRKNGGVQFGGNPYLDDPELADLFAFLMEDNEARQAVERGDDLREVIMRPIDTAEIEREISDAERRKRNLDEELERLAELEEELPGLKSERTTVERELEETREELADVEERLEDVEVDPAESKDRKEELESVFADLREKRRELEDVEYELETERATVEELEAERDELEDDLEDAGGGQADEADLEGRISELRTRKRSLDETVSELQSVIGFNEEMLDDNGLVADGALDREPAADTGEALTDQLVDGETTTCWTCGSDVPRDRIESTLDRLRSLRSEKLSERNDVTEQIDELQAKRKRRREAREERERTERRIEQVETELERARERIETLENKRSRLETEAADLEAETEEFEQTDYSEALELHREANRLELEVDRLESEREELTERIEEYEEALEEIDDIERRREQVQEELTDLRMRVDRLEADAVESFNEHIESILEILEYDNIDRIWIERREDEVRDGRRKVTKSTFDLHVVRSANGSALQDSIDHLSESERNVTGLVFALAGYLVHDVHEELPFMLLDSLEAIDSGRIAALVEYFEDHVEYLVVALLTEDAQALENGHAMIESI